MAACRAKLGCVRQRFLSKVFLGNTNVEPPKDLSVILITDQGREPVGESYSRVPVEFKKSTAPGIYENVQPLRFQPRIHDENWGRISAYAVAMSNGSGVDCTCMGGLLKKSQSMSAGDVFLFDKGALRVMFAGHQLGASATLNETFSRFIFEGRDFEPPSEFWMGLFSASPAGRNYVECAEEGYVRKRVRWSPGSNGLEAYNSDRIAWTAGPSDWLVSSIGVWAGPDAFSADHPLLIWQKLPFGPRVMEPGTMLPIEAGTFRIG